MIQLLRLASVILFLALGYRLHFLQAPAARRRGINLLLGYLVALSLAVGVTGRDNWPFSSYPLLVSQATVESVVSELEVVGLDANGQEWAIDPLSWSPVFPLALRGWFNRTFPSLRDNERRRAGEFLLARAEQARRRLLHGERIGSERLLGRVAAPPDWGVYRRKAVPPTAFAALRVYHVVWRPRERLADPRRLSRTLLFEHPQP
jgi:hypothetical protein